VQIAFVLYPELTALDLVGPIEVLARVPGVDGRVVAAEPGTTTADSGILRLVAEAALTDVPRPDVVVVPGGSAGTLRAAQDSRLLAWLRELAPTATWITSVCAGSLILGAAGLLDGRRATGHWAALDELRGYGATPETGRFVVDGKVVTASGVSAGIDMALWLAAELAGEPVGRLIELMIEYDPAPPHGTGSPTAAGGELEALGRQVMQYLFATPLAAQAASDRR